ncbi:hypothetical protein EDD15DRAFT_872235 [Pisolithus albus]|nr:hypothetical protein EDD15DRAFT_872235 [Pisolithus albus]
MDNELVTFPVSDGIIVSCDQIVVIGELWGPIVIERPGGRSVTFSRAHTHSFRTCVTRAEVDRISSFGRDNYQSIVDAYRRRTARRELGAQRLGAEGGDEEGGLSWGAAVVVWRVGDLLSLS